MWEFGVKSTVGLLLSPNCRGAAKDGQPQQQSSTRKEQHATPLSLAVASSVSLLSKPLQTTSFCPFSRTLGRGAPTRAGAPCPLSATASASADISSLPCLSYLIVINKLISLSVHIPVLVGPHGPRGPAITAGTRNVQGQQQNGVNKAAPSRLWGCFSYALSGKLGGK